MDKRGQTVSATEFATLTGVSRERLRTWERRFGFPRPARVGQGRRRYAVEDAVLVVAVRRAAEEGVPLPRAIADAGKAPVSGVSAETLAGVTVASPMPVVLVGGPEPLVCRLANAPAQALAAGPTGHAGLAGLAPGQPLASVRWFAGSELERSLRTLFATATPLLECSHPAWAGDGPTARSIAYRLPVAAGEPPTVAVIGVEHPRELEARRELGDLQAELLRVRAREQRQERALGLASAIAERFQEDAADAVIASTSDTLVRRLGAVDAGIAVYMAGELALGSSSRGLLGPRMVPVAGYQDLGGLLRAAEPGWLSSVSGRAFGMPSSLHCLAVPIAVLGETLGVLLLVFDEPRELDADARQLLRIVSSGLGFALLRDRLVEATAKG